MSREMRLVFSRGASDDTGHRLFERALLGCLLARGLEVDVTGHLYDLRGGDDELCLLQECDDNLVVLSWLYPRAAYWVLDANQVRGKLGATSFFPPEEAAALDTDRHKSDQRTIWCLDLRSSDKPEVIAAEVERIYAANGRPLSMVVPAEASTDEARSAELLPRWYPVIDHDRCTDCLECLNFCLFGVFDLDTEDRIRVDQPDACRAGCPACGRICPSGAIMFPSHDDPAIAGSVDAAAGGGAIQAALLGGGPAALRAARDEQSRAREVSPASDPLDGLVDRLDGLN